MTQTAEYLQLDTEAYRGGMSDSPPPANRRSKVRFPIDLPLCYHTIGRLSLSGVGRVLNISSKDVWVICPHRLTPGTPVELLIDWPIRLNGEIDIQLVMNGRVCRCDIDGFAVSFDQHRFRRTAPSVTQRPEARQIDAEADSVCDETSPAVFAAHLSGAGQSELLWLAK